jgi:hypothetical protein
MFGRQSQVVNLREASMTQDAAFGQAATFNTDVGFSLAVSPDRKAFSANFSGLEVIIQGTSAAPIATRVFSFSIPLSGTYPGQEIPFTVQGHSLSQKEATAHLVFSVNDQTTVVDFPVNSDASFEQKLKYKAGDATDARITVFLLADRDARSDSGVQVNVVSIDADLGQKS